MPESKDSNVELCGEKVITDIMLRSVQRNLRLATVPYEPHYNSGVHVNFHIASQLILHYCVDNPIFLHILASHP